MKKAIKIGMLCPLLIILIAVTSCTKLDEKVYSSVTPENYFKTQNDVYSFFGLSNYRIQDYLRASSWRAQEIGTDELTLPKRGADWYDGGKFVRFQHHAWNEQDDELKDRWLIAVSGITQIVDIKGQLSGMDLTKFNISDDVKKGMLAQCDCRMAYLYLRGLDFFGDFVIYDPKAITLPKRSKAEKVFNLIETTLTTALPNLPKKTSGQDQDGTVTQGGAAAMLIQLYLNAERYTNKPMYDKCKEIAQKLINGDYGGYSLDPNWNGRWNKDNYKSNDMLWCLRSRKDNGWRYGWVTGSNHYNVMPYFNNSLTGDGNGWCLSPSSDPFGKAYTSKMGRPYAKMNDKDLRKQPYQYWPTTDNFTGMLLVGLLRNQVTGVTATGVKEISGQPLIMYDQICRYSILQGNTHADTAALVSSVEEGGDENSGIRCVKIFTPDDNHIDEYYSTAAPIYTLSEAYFALAECKYRSGDKGGAADLINAVRKRNFAGGVDPDPVTSANLDDYRFLDEYMIEFLWEGRRRPDLIRWGKYHTESWWDHVPSALDQTPDPNNYGKPMSFRYPVPQAALAGNPKLNEAPE